MMALVAEEKIIWDEYVANPSPEVREQLVLKSVPLVHYILRRLGITQEMGPDYEDMVHQGLLGLIEAVDRFDPTYGTRFSTYASLRIRGRVLDFLRHADWLPRAARRRVRFIQQAISTLWSELKREPTEEEIGSRLGLGIEEVQRGLMDSSLIILSLDSPVEQVDSEESEDLYDRLEDKTQVDPADSMEDSDLKSELIKGIKSLSEREQMILSLYYYEELTFKEIGKVLAITESRVCQLHARAIMNLKAVI
jgi:RNA polymerase sigma factor FliA